VKLNSLRISNFRNIASADLIFHERFNVLHGNNAQGKTNVLEAVFLLTGMKSFRNAKNVLLVQDDKPQAFLEAKLEMFDLDHIVTVEINKRKSVKCDGKSIKATQNRFQAVVFSVDELRIGRGSPGDRRNFLDRAVFLFEPNYDADYRNYHRVLQQRNQLLRHWADGKANPDLLSVYDEQLADYGFKLRTFRDAYLEYIDAYFRETFVKITGGHGIPRLKIIKTGLEAVDSSESFQTYLTQKQPRDIASKTTLTGPHRDDLELTIDGRLVRDFASQGQQRAMILALKIAEIRALKEKFGDFPLLLLDDISSELDPEKKSNLFQFLLEQSGQVIITTTDKMQLELEGPHQAWTVQDGTFLLDGIAA
jgi:DNA replication and repair protein RecF